MVSTGIELGGPDVLSTPDRETETVSGPPTPSDDPFVVIDDIEHYRIDDVDRMEPFLTTVVSDADLWMFVSSAGSLAAGRTDATRAVFPYLPDDMLHRGSGSAGPITALARDVGGVRELWRPFHGVHLADGLWPRACSATAWCSKRATMPGR